MSHSSSVVPQDSLHAARSAYQAGHLAQARHYASEALRRDPGCVDAMVCAAQAAFRLGDFVDASRDFQRAAERGAGIEAWLNAAGAAARGGQAPRGRELYRRACLIDPMDGRGWDGLARTTALVGDGPATIAALERLVEVDGSPDQWLRLATSYRNQQRHREARFAYGMVLLYEPTYLPARFEAMQALPVPQYDEADLDRWCDAWVRDLTFFESLLPDDPLLLRYRAEILAGQPNFYLHALPVLGADLQRRFARMVARWCAAEFGPALGTFPS